MKYKSVIIKQYPVDGSNLELNLEVIDQGKEESDEDVIYGRASDGTEYSIVLKE